MKARYTFALAALGAAVSLSLGVLIVRAQDAPAPKAAVQLRLAAEKQTVQKDEKGKLQVVWQALPAEASAQPGDVFRFVVNGENAAAEAVSGLVVTQPIPEGMEYVLQSTAADAKRKADVVYSIDGGKSFTANPTVKVALPRGGTELRPAPASAYTHVRWTLQKPLAAKSSVKLAYQARVR